MTAITPAGAGDNKSQGLALVSAESVQNFVHGCMLRERNRIARLIRAKAWVVRDAAGVVNIEGSIDALATTIASTGEDQHVFQWKGPGVQ